MEQQTQILSFVDSEAQIQEIINSFKSEETLLIKNPFVVSNWETANAAKEWMQKVFTFILEHRRIFIAEVLFVAISKDLVQTSSVPFKFWQDFDHFVQLTIEDSNTVRAIRDADNKEGVTHILVNMTIKRFSELSTEYNIALEQQQYFFDFDESREKSGRLSIDMYISLYNILSFKITRV